MFDYIKGETVKSIVDALNIMCTGGRLFSVVYIGKSGSTLYPFCAVIKLKNRGE